MKKALFLFIILSIILSAGCSALSEIESAPPQTVLPIPSVTPAATIAPSPTPTSIPARTPAPTMTRTPEPTPEVREEARFLVDLNGDGKDETIVVCIVNNHQLELYDAVSLEVLERPESRILITDYFTFSGAYMTWTLSGQPCVLISWDVCAEYNDTTYVYSFNGLIPVMRSKTYAVVQDIDGTALTMCSWVETVGDWWYTQEYKLTDVFKLEPVSDMMIETRGREPIHTIRDLPVEILIGGTYVEDTLPSDTLLCPVSADGEGHMTFRLEDGRTGRITYTRNEDGYTLIDGVDVNEYFDYLVYFG